MNAAGKAPIRVAGGKASVLFSQHNNARSHLVKTTLKYLSSTPTLLISLSPGSPTLLFQCTGYTAKFP